MIKLTFYDIGALVTMVVTTIAAAIIGPITVSTMMAMIVMYIVATVAFGILFPPSRPKK